MERDIFDEYATKIFYGFKLDPKSGRLTVETIKDGEAPIELPQIGYLKSGYKQWLFSKRALQFSLNNGHLQVKII